MIDLVPALVELIRLAATDLPEDVENMLLQAYLNEEDRTPAKHTLQTILENVKIARAHSKPICQDTGTPIFYGKLPPAFTQDQVSRAIRSAMTVATAKSFLRPNAVFGLDGKTTLDNAGDRYLPYLHYSPSSEETLCIDLLLKGGGCENVGRQYALPDSDLRAERDWEGVRRAALDAVYRAQGLGCAPGFLGIAIGGDRGTSHLAAKEVFFEAANSRSKDESIARLELEITRQANQLGIGPMGLGGRTTILNTRVTNLYRLPASCFVSVSYMCWAYRRRRLNLKNDLVLFE